MSEGRRRTVFGSAAAALFAMAGCAPAPPRPSLPAGAAGRGELPVLRPWSTVYGGRMVASFGPLGEPLPGAADRAMRLLRPVAAAGRQNDLYVLDLGLGALLRHDLVLGTFVPVPGVVPRAGTRFAVLSDATVLVLDEPSRRVLRLSRSGRLLRSYAAGADLSRPIDLAADEARGLLYVVDAGSNRIFAFRLGTGAAVIVVPGGDRRTVAFGVGAIAVDADTILLVDRLARQVLRMAPDGRVVDAFGHADLKAPRSIAVDRHGRVFVVDMVDDTLKVFAGHRMIEVWPAARLGVQTISDVSIVDSVLAVTDSVGAQVRLMRVIAPTPPVVPRGAGEG